MTKYVIRRVRPGDPGAVRDHASSSTGSSSPRPAAPTAKFANNPRITAGAAGDVQEGLGPRPARSRSSTAAGWGSATRSSEGTCTVAADAGGFIGPTGLPNFLPTAISGATNGVLHGDFGYSISTGEEVSKMIARAALPTFILAGTSLVVWLTVRRRSSACTSAIRRYSLFDHATTDLLLRRLRDAHVLARHHADLHLQRPGPEHPPGERHDRDARRRRRSAATPTGPTSAANPITAIARHREAPDPAGRHARRGQHRR